MGKRQIFIVAAFALLVGAAIFFASRKERTARIGSASSAPPGFVTTDGARFLVDGRPFRFVGANAAVIFGDEERAGMQDTLREAARDGVRVVRVWAFGESGADDGPDTGVARNEWLKQNPFRRGPDEWNEDAFVNLDRVIAESARHNLRVQICLTNWWRDTGGVVRYLRWAGAPDAADETQPFGISVERAMLFYTDEKVRQLYRQHVERIVARRNTVTGVLYKDDPAIMGYELMNEAQAVTGRWQERRAWVAEMSAFIKSLDPHHLVAPGTWGYRASWERREWLEEHRLQTIDYCDVHIYPSDDLDSYVDSTQALGAFVDNRAAASYSIRKPLVFGEFGMTHEGYRGISQTEWYRAYFESVARAGLSGAMFWRWTPDTKRGYNITFSTPQDEGVRAEIRRGAALFSSLQYDWPPPSRLREASRHLVPHQFAFNRQENERGVAHPQIVGREDGALLYRFRPEQAMSARFEKIGAGDGYLWGAGVGLFEYVVPARDNYRKVGRLVVRAHLQPVLPVDARPSDIATRVTLLINGRDCGSRLIPIEDPKQPLIQEWVIDSYMTRLDAARGKPLNIRFVVNADADKTFGINISNWPEGYDARGAQPVELEIR